MLVCLFVYFDQGGLDHGGQAGLGGELDEVAGGGGLETADKLGREEELGDAQQYADEQVPRVGAHVHLLYEELVDVERVAAYVAHTLALQIRLVEEEIARVEEEYLQRASGADARRRATGRRRRRRWRQHVAACVAERIAVESRRERRGASGVHARVAPVAHLVVVHVRGVAARCVQQ